jgi:hypothetical protein
MTMTLDKKIEFEEWLFGELLFGKKIGCDSPGPVFRNIMQLLKAQIQCKQFFLNIT